jgi:hypothetical protein
LTRLNAIFTKLSNIDWLFWLRLFKSGFGSTFFKGGFSKVYFQRLIFKGGFGSCFAETFLKGGFSKVDLAPPFSKVDS